MPQKRIYAVFDAGKAIALVRTNSRAKALAHVLGDRFEAVVADQDHLVNLIGDGFQVEDPSEPELPL